MHLVVRKMAEGSDVLKSKEKNFSGYFQVSEDELRDLLGELEDAKNTEFHWPFC